MNYERAGRVAMLGRTEDMQNVFRSRKRGVFVGLAHQPQVAKVGGSKVCSGVERYSQGTESNAAVYPQRTRPSQRSRLMTGAPRPVMGLVMDVHARSSVAGMGAPKLPTVRTTWKLFRMAFRRYTCAPLLLFGPLLPPFFFSSKLSSLTTSVAQFEHIQRQH